ncbi:MAG: hypothetical protein R3E66_17415 [bacterium]
MVRYLVALSLVALVGCDSKAGVDVQTEDGTKVQVGADGVKVEAPNANVEVNKDGVNVEKKAQTAEVEAKEGEAEVKVDGENVEAKDGENTVKVTKEGVEANGVKVDLSKGVKVTIPSGN